MELPFFFKGMLLGFSMSAPVGPLGVLCIRRTLVNGFTNGLVTGLGTAAGDAICVRGGIYRYNCKATVDDEVAVEAAIMCTMRKVV